MTVTGKIELGKIKEELINLLRVNITDPKSRGTLTADTFDGDDSTVDFLINRTNVKSIVNVEYPVSTVLTFGTDYTYDTDFDNAGTKTTKITFAIAPALGTDNIEVNYNYGESWIYGDYPQPRSSLSDFPRIAVDILLGSSFSDSLDGAHKRTNLTISITVYDFKVERLDGLIDSIREVIMNNQKSLYYSTYITPSNMSPLVYTEGTSNKVLQRTVDFDSLYNFEVIS